MSLKPEDIAHINLVNWFHYTFPELADDFHHFDNEHYLKPNESGSHWQAGRKRKRMGVKKGVADFFLALPLDGKSGLWIELKVGKNRPSKEQQEFLARKALRGYAALCVWEEEGAKQVILAYLGKTFA